MKKKNVMFIVALAVCYVLAIVAFILSVDGTAQTGSGLSIPDSPMIPAFLVFAVASLGWGILYAVGRNNDVAQIFLTIVTVGKTMLSLIIEIVIDLGYNGANTFSDAKAGTAVIMFLISVVAAAAMEFVIVILKRRNKT